MTSKKHSLFSSDTYQADSIKAQHRLWHGLSEKFIVYRPATRKPSFLTNEENKKQLCSLLPKLLGTKEAAPRLEKCSTSLVIMEGRALQHISLNNEVRKLDEFTMLLK